MEGDAALSVRRHVFETPWQAYALAWSSRPDARFRLGLGSFLQTQTNHIAVVELKEETDRLEIVAEIEHPFPPTKLMWRPPSESFRDKPDLLASSCTTLNIWELEDGQLKLAAKLANTRTQRGPNQSGHLPPLTSFDWSLVNPNKIGASSVDTTCTIWNVEKQKIETQLIAHDKAVYDIAFSGQDMIFASVGADGSVRLFDQRNLDHSTIIYEASPSAPLLRLAWNRINTNHIATIAMDSPGVNLIDIRRPSIALTALSYHDSCVNHIAWAPHSANHLLCGTDDGFAIIWDVKEVLPARVENAAALAARNRPAPLVAYDCDYEVQQVHWPQVQPDYVALGTANHVRVLQV